MLLKPVIEGRLAKSDAERPTSAEKLLGLLAELQHSSNLSFVEHENRKFLDLLSRYENLTPGNCTRVAGKRGRENRSRHFNTVFRSGENLEVLKQHIDILLSILEDGQIGQLSKRPTIVDWEQYALGNRCTRPELIARTDAGSGFGPWSGRFCPAARPSFG